MPYLGPDATARLAHAVHGASFRVGVAVGRAGEIVAVGDDGPLPLGGVFKLVLAHRTLARIDAGRERPDATHRLAEADKAPGGPLVARPAGTTVTVAELIELALTRSCNTAASLLQLRLDPTDLALPDLAPPPPARAAYLLAAGAVPPVLGLPPLEAARTYLALDARGRDELVALLLREGAALDAGALAEAAARFERRFASDLAELDELLDALAPARLVARLLLDWHERAVAGGEPWRAAWAWLRRPVPLRLTAALPAGLAAYGKTGTGAGTRADAVALVAERETTVVVALGSRVDDPVAADAVLARLGQAAASL